jgi:hypothetical protein
LWHRCNQKLFCTIYQNPFNTTAALDKIISVSETIITRIVNIDICEITFGSSPLKPLVQMVLYKDCSFHPDPLTNMAAIGNSCFWLVRQVSDTVSAHWASSLLNECNVVIWSTYLYSTYSCISYYVLYFLSWTLSSSP